MRILIINGPNLNLLGVREPDIYGGKSYADLCKYIEQKCASLGAECEIFQSNHEGALVDKIQQALSGFDALIINPAAYTHTSVAILDALKCLDVPRVEVHLTDIDAREEFRRFSFASLACERVFKGGGFGSYGGAIEYIVAKNGR